MIGGDIQFANPEFFWLFLLLPVPLGIAVLWGGADPLAHPLLCRLGPEPLGDTFDAERLYRLARGRRAPVKNFLMDSQVVVGVGNIYASEALFRAGIHPSRASNRISLTRYRALVDAIHERLNARSPFPIERAAQVSQYGVDYVYVEGGTDLTLDFYGETRARLLDTQPHSGDYFWYANRGDDSDTRLQSAALAAMAEGKAAQQDPRDIAEALDDLLRLHAASVGARRDCSRARHRRQRAATERGRIPRRSCADRSPAPTARRHLAGRPDNNTGLAGQ